MTQNYSPGSSQHIKLKVKSGKLTDMLRKGAQKKEENSLFVQNMSYKKMSLMSPPQFQSAQISKMEICKGVI